MGAFGAIAQVETQASIVAKLAGAAVGVLSLSVSTAALQVLETSGAVTPPLQVNGISNATASMGQARWATDSSGALRVTGKSRGGGVIGTQGILNSGDVIGQDVYTGSDGVGMIRAVSVDVLVDAAPSVGIMPGLWRVRTNNASGVSTTGLSVNSAQQVLASSVGTEALPSLCVGALTVGAYRPATNTLGLVTSATEWGRCSTSGAWTLSRQSIPLLTAPTALNAALTTHGIDGTASNISVVAYGNAGAATAAVYATTVRGTGASITPTDTGDVAQFAMRGATAAGALNGTPGAGVLITARSTWSASNKESDLDLQTVASGASSATSRLRAHSDGGVQIRTSLGTTSPGAGQLWSRGFQGDSQTVSTTGVITALASDTFVIRLTGAAPDLQGIAAPTIGCRYIRLYCVNAITLRHNNAGASAANQITTDTGADVAVAAGKTVPLVYDDVSTKWRVVRY